MKEKASKKKPKVLEKQLEEEKKKKEEYLNHLQRLQAEFENYQKRSIKEQTEFLKFAKKDLILELLQVIDNLYRALENTEDEGVKLIHNQLYSILEKEGVKEIDSNGQFDPLMHEAVIKEQSEKEEGEIISILEKGYQLHGKIIRPAKVKVSGGKNE